MRRGVPGHGQVLLALPQDLVHDGGGQTIRAETTHGQVVAILDERRHGLLHGRQLVGEGPILASEELPRLIRGGVGIKLAERWKRKIHGIKSQSRGQS